MIQVYGIKTWGSVRKALSFFKEYNIEVDFFDTKKESPSPHLIQSWCDKTNIDLIFNSRGTKYRTLKLKELNLDDSGKIDWLCKEPMLLKRPITSFNKKVMVGFNEEDYKREFL